MTPGRLSSPNRRLRAARRRGVAILYVLLILVWVGAAMTLLADASGSLAFQTRREYVEACSGDLQASAAAWADLHPDAPRDRPVSLDTADLSAPQPAIEIVPADDGAVRIRTRCRKGRWAVRRELARPRPAAAD